MKKTRTFRFSGLLLAGMLAASPCVARTAWAGDKSKVDNKAAEEAVKKVNADFSKEFEGAKTAEERRAVLDKWSKWRESSGGLAGGVDRAAGSGSYGGSSSGGWGMGDYFKQMMMMQLASTAAGIVSQLINKAIDAIMNPKSPKDAADAAKRLGDLERERETYENMKDKAGSGLNSTDPNAGAAPTGDAGRTVPGLPSLGGDTGPSGGNYYGGGNSGGVTSGPGTLFESPLGGGGYSGGGGGGGFGGVPGNPFGGGDGRGGEGKGADGLNGDKKPGDEKGSTPGSDGKAGGSSGLGESTVAEEVTRKKETVSGRLIFLPKPKAGDAATSGGEATPADPATPPADPAEPGMGAAPAPASGGETLDPVEEPSGRHKGTKPRKEAPKGRGVRVDAKVSSKANDAAKANKLKGIKSKKTAPELVDALVRVEMTISEWRRAEKAKAEGVPAEEAAPVEGATKPGEKGDGLDAFRDAEGKLDLTKCDVWLVSDWKKETPRRFRVTFDPDAAAQLTHPAQGAAVVVQGSVAKLDVDKQILDELRGEVNEVEIRQVMLAAGGPKPEEQPTDGQ